MKIKKEGNLLTVLKETGAFNTIFRDSLFEYSQGVLLIDRMYKKDFCIKEEVTSSVFNKKDEKTLKDFISLTSSIPSVKEMSEKQSEFFTDKVNEMCEKVKNISPKKATVDRYFYKHDQLTKIPLKSVKELSKEEIEIRAVLSASFIISYFRQMFFDDDFLNGLSIAGIDQEEYLDIVMIPVSNEKEE